MDLASLNVGFFRQCDHHKGGQNIPLLGLLHDIQGGRWRKPVEALRKLAHGSPEYAKAKKRLPCIQLSATTLTGRRGIADIAEHTGLAQVDVDKLGADKAVLLRERFAGDPYVLATWLSPGGEGVKAVICVEPSKGKHPQSIEAIRRHVQHVYGIAIDPHCGDITRLCFVGYDPDLKLNSEAVELPCSGSDIGTKTAQSPSSLPQTPLSSAILRSTIYDLPSTAHPQLWKDYPKLEHHYRRNVLRYWSEPQIGSRYESIQGITSGLFTILAPSMVLECLKAYWCDHKPVFSDYPLNQALHEAQSILKGCEASYPVKRLSVQEATIYQSLPSEREQAAFRICHSLSLSTANEEVPPPLFFLSSDELGTRLGTHGFIASRILNRLLNRGALKKEVNGVPRTKGVRGKATFYSWALPSLQQDSDEL